MVKKIILFFALILSMNSIAQKQSTSPYSFFGIGNQFLSKTVEESMMGGVGTAFSDPYHLNFSNPAGLSGLKYTTYALGGVNTSLNLTAEGNGTTQTQKTSAFSLSYLAIGFPVGKKAAFSAGLRSKIGVGYELQSGDNTTSEGLSVYEGNGGGSSLFFGGGIKVFKGFSVGLEGSYLFGDIDNTVIWKQDNAFYDTRSKTEATLRGLEAKLGFHYSGSVSKKKAYQLGLVFLKGNTIDITEKSQIASGFFQGDLENIKSSLSETSLVGGLSTPIKTTFAFAYGDVSKWQASAEYSMNNAISYTGSVLQNNLQKVTFDRYQRLSIGGYYIPKYNSLSSYLSTVIYRAGIKYENTGMLIQGEALEDFGISFGVGLPIGRGRISEFNIGFEYGIRGEVSNSLIKEEYLNVRLSLSLADKWFKKRKID